jgi:hypothetical protein
MLLLNSDISKLANIFGKMDAGSVSQCGTAALAQILQ